MTETSDWKSNTDKYKDFCLKELSIPVFSQSWWLDATVGEGNWDVVLVERSGKIVATLPYTVKRRMGFKIISQPALTQTLGPWFVIDAVKYSKRLGQEKDLLEQLISDLPAYDSYNQNWHYSRTNWLPFYWNGFKQTTRYSYRIPELHSEEYIWSGLQQNIRSDIRKAKNRFSLKIRTDVEIDEFLDLTTKTFKRQGKKLPYSRSYVKRLDSACEKNNARKIFVAEDSKGQLHAGAYIVWDSNSAYYLIGGGDPMLRNSGATSLCLWEAILFSSKVTKSFDFEGSMLEPVERFFRAFGAVQTPYSNVSRIPSRILLIKEAMQTIIRN